MTQMKIYNRIEKKRQNSCINRWEDGSTDYVYMRFIIKYWPEITCFYIHVNGFLFVFVQKCPINFFTDETF